MADSVLLIVRSEDLVARCKVAWRKTNELGVRFVRVGGLDEEERMKEEQQSSYQLERQQLAENQQRECEQAELEELQRQQLHAQRIAQINAARMQIMGMDPTKPYSEEDLKSAYRRQAMNKHPDQGVDPLEFQQLSKIYNLMLHDLQAAAETAEAAPEPIQTDTVGPTTGT